MEIIPQILLFVSLIGNIVLSYIIKEDLDFLKQHRESREAKDELIANLEHQIVLHQRMNATNEILLEFYRKDIARLTENISNVLHA